MVVERRLDRGNRLVFLARELVFRGFGRLEIGDVDLGLGIEAGNDLVVHLPDEFVGPVEGGGAADVRSNRAAVLLLVARPGFGDVEGPARLGLIVPSPILVLDAIGNELGAKGAIHDVEEAGHFPLVVGGGGDAGAVGFEEAEAKLHARTGIGRGKQGGHRHVFLIVTIGRPVFFLVVGIVLLGSDDVGRGRDEGAKALAVGRHQGIGLVFRGAAIHEARGPHARSGLEVIAEGIRLRDISEAGPVVLNLAGIGDIPISLEDEIAKVLERFGRDGDLVAHLAVVIRVEGIEIREDADVIVDGEDLGRVIDAVGGAVGIRVGRVHVFDPDVVDEHLVGEIAGHVFRGDGAIHLAIADGRGFRRVFLLGVDAEVVLEERFVIRHVVVDEGPDVPGAVGIGGIVERGQGVEMILRVLDLLGNRVVEQEHIGLVVAVFPHGGTAVRVGARVGGRELEIQVRDLREMLEHLEVFVFRVSAAMGRENLDCDGFLHDLIGIFRGSLRKKIIGVVGPGSAAAAGSEGDAHAQEGKGFVDRFFHSRILLSFHATHDDALLEVLLEEGVDDEKR